MAGTGEASKRCRRSYTSPIAKSSIHPACHLDRRRPCTRSIRNNAAPRGRMYFDMAALISSPSIAFNPTTRALVGSRLLPPPDRTNSPRNRFDMQKAQRRRYINQLSKSRRRIPRTKLRNLLYPRYFRKPTFWCAPSTNFDSFERLDFSNFGSLASFPG
jgi:hypothetical protein